jgi:competence protein ComEC
VLQVSNAEFSILQPGDIEASVENQLASQYGESLHSDVLVAAHHGSNTSSSSRFIAAVEPQVGVFSAGYRSQFGHPTEKVQGRFKELGASLLNTSETGMISFTFPGSKEGSSQKAAPIIEIYRKQHPKYWN